MDLEVDKYYHLYNRSNSRELLFKNKDNYLYFLRKFRARFDELVKVFAYCLMPTHFHFFIKIETEEIELFKEQIGIHLSSYTKAINNAFDRNGSLFQQHTKAKLVTDNSQLIRLITYIHQNPVRAGLVDELMFWPYSSYPDLAGLRDGSLVDRSIVEQYFNSREDFVAFSKRTISSTLDR